MTIYPDLVNAMGDVNVQVNGLCLKPTDEPILQIVEFQVRDPTALEKLDSEKCFDLSAIDMQSEKRSHSRMQNDTILSMGNEIGLSTSGHE